MNEKREKHLIDIISHLLVEINGLSEDEHGKPYPEGHNDWVDAARKIVAEAAHGDWEGRYLGSEDFHLRCAKRMFEETRDRKPLVNL